MNESDSRHISKMRQQIESFENREIGLKALIGDLLFLRDALSDVDSDWEYQFTQRVADLESAYSYALEKNSDQSEEVSHKVVSEAIPRIFSLIEKH